MSDAPGILLDTSVLLAGVASPKGASYALLLLGQLGLIQVIVTPYILEEAERNLTKRLSNALPTIPTTRPLEGH
jgi:predicted nucleic acid-binding protein